MESNSRIKLNSSKLIRNVTCICTHVFVFTKEQKMRNGKFKKKTEVSVILQVLESRLTYACN